MHILIKIANVFLLRLMQNTELIGQKGNQIFSNKTFMLISMSIFVGGIPYTAHRAQIPPPLILTVVYFYAYLSLG